MTSANVSDVPILLNFGQTQVQSAAKSENSSCDFSDLMIQNVTISDLPTATKDVTAKDDLPTLDKTSSDFSTAKKIPQATDDKASNLKGKDITAEKQAINEFADGVKEVLEEELEVTDEQIVAAMEALGLTYMDLLNPSNLTKLISELSPEDSIQLLVTNTVGNILDQVQDLGVTLLSNVDMDVESLKAVELFDDGFAPVMEEMTVVTDDIQNVVPMNPLTEATEKVDVTLNKEADVTIAEDIAPIVIDDQRQASKQPVNATSSVEVDETNDLAEEPESGMENLIQNTGETSKEDDGTNQNMFNRSTTQRNVVKEATTQNTESVATTSFQNTVSTVTTESEVVTTYTTGIDTKDIIQQIVTNAKVTITNTITTMEMELNPAHLGRMILNVAENDGKVTAHITLQNEAVRHAMETQMAVLKDNLNQQGIKVEAVEVSVGTHEFERNLEEGQQMQQQAEEQSREAAKASKGRNINLNNLDELQGLMSDEEALVASMMRDAGNSINFTA